MKMTTVGRDSSTTFTANVISCSKDCIVIYHGIDENRRQSVIYIVLGPAIVQRRGGISVKKYSLRWCIILLQVQKLHTQKLTLGDDICFQATTSSEKSAIENHRFGDTVLCNRSLFRDTEWDC